MTASDELRGLIERRRNKAIRQVLDVVDDLVDPHTHQREKAAIRKVVLDELNDFTDVVLGLVDRTTDDTSTYNVHALDMIAAMYERVVGEPAPVNGAVHAE